MYLYGSYCRDHSGPLGAWGDRDLVLPPRQVWRAARAIPHARFVPLPGCGHIPTYDDPELVARVMLEASRTA